MSRVVTMHEVIASNLQQCQLLAVSPVDVWLDVTPSTCTNAWESHTIVSYFGGKHHRAFTSSTRSLEVHKEYYYLCSESVVQVSVILKKHIPIQLIILPKLQQRCFVPFSNVRLFSPWRRSSQQFSTEIFMCSFKYGVTKEQKEEDGEEIRRNVLVGHPDRGTPTSCH